MGEHDGQHETPKHTTSNDVSQGCLVLFSALGLSAIVMASAFAYSVVMGCG